MRFADMKLGTKIGSGFAALLVIAMGLGGLAVWDMLAEEYVPEVTIVSVLERNALNMALGVRTYQYSEEDIHLKEGMGNLELTRKSLKDVEGPASTVAHMAFN